MTEVTTSPRKTAAADNAKTIYTAYGVTASDVRAWAKVNGVPVADRGRLHPDVLSKFVDAMAAGQTAA